MYILYSCLFPDEVTISKASLWSLLKIDFVFVSCLSAVIRFIRLAGALIIFSGRPQKKLFFLVAQPLRTSPPPPLLQLSGYRNFFCRAVPLKKVTFFAASLRTDKGFQSKLRFYFTQLQSVSFHRIHMTGLGTGRIDYMEMRWYCHRPAL